MRGPTGHGEAEASADRQGPRAKHTEEPQPGPASADRQGQAPAPTQLPKRITGGSHWATVSRRRTERHRLKGYLLRNKKSELFVEFERPLVVPPLSPSFSLVPIIKGKGGKKGSLRGKKGGKPLAEKRLSACKPFANETRFRVKTG